MGFRIETKIWQFNQLKISAGRKKVRKTFRNKNVFNSIFCRCYSFIECLIIAEML